jgi:hypothetical protein
MTQHLLHISLLTAAPSGTTCTWKILVYFGDCSRNTQFHRLWYFSICWQCIFRHLMRLAQQPPTKSVTFSAIVSTVWWQSNLTTPTSVSHCLHCDVSYHLLCMSSSLELERQPFTANSLQHLHCFHCCHDYCPRPCIFQLHSGTHHTHQSNRNWTIWLCIDGVHVKTSACMPQWCCWICFCPRVQWKYHIQCQIIGWLDVMNLKESTRTVMIYFKVLSQNLPAGTCRTTKTLEQDSQSLGRVPNLEPPAYEAGVPSIWLWCLE